MARSAESAYGFPLNRALNEIEAKALGRERREQTPLSEWYPWNSTLSTWRATDSGVWPRSRIDAKQRRHQLAFRVCAKRGRRAGCEYPLDTSFRFALIASAYGPSLRICLLIHRWRFA